MTSLQRGIQLPSYRGELTALNGEDMVAVRESGEMRWMEDVFFNAADGCDQVRWKVSMMHKVRQLLEVVL